MTVLCCTEVSERNQSRTSCEICVLVRVYSFGTERKADEREREI